MQYEVSVIIPARNEEWISNTVADLLKNSTAKTEIIVVLDGHWAEPGIVDHPNVKIIYLSESIGQRAATNLGVKLSKAKWVVKCDAHCAFDYGWDTKMLEAAGDNLDWTMVPIMRNLHVFDWKCMKCGKRTYQGPTPTTRNAFTECADCGNSDVNKFKKKLVWYAKPSPQSTAYCFDPEPHFQYFGSFKKRPEGQGNITPTMSLQGSFFMCTREKYWALNLGDESFGSWGSQGLQVACSTWLTGGQVMCVHTTWYAHCFRTQGGNFSFPYPQQQSKVEEAKRRARQIFFNNKVPNQIHRLSWLVEKFWPIEHWTDKDLQDLKESESK